MTGSIRTDSHLRAAGVVGILMLTAFVEALAGCGDKEAGSGEYYCPMHPTYTSDRPGDCPICNMSLVRREPAVVAEEVRRLAQRSAESAKETEDLIRESLDIIRAGRDLVEESLAEFYL